MGATMVTKRLQSKQDKPVRKPESPRLTFVLPTFNREKTLGAALAQITSQIQRSKFRSSFSVLISENHSTDRSANIARDFASRYDFIKVVSPQNHLPSGEHNLFFALRHVDADLVWTFADDDLLLPGAIDWIYERLTTSKADFVLVNSQYQDSNGQVLRDRILEMNQEAIYFDSFAEIFTEVGPLTLLASFSSAIFRPEKVCALELDRFLVPCAIYAHVFAYLEAFSDSCVEILSAPVVVLRRTTATAHWETVAKRFDWYMYYPWTGSLAAHLLRARSHGAISCEQYGFALNSNENGRYGLIANLLTQFILQLLRALEVGDPREIPPKSDFEDVRTVVQDVPYVTVETLDLLVWCEKHFSDVCAFLSPPGSELQRKPGALTNAIQTLGIAEQAAPWISKAKNMLIARLHAIKSSYVNFGTMASEARPYVFMAGTNYLVFQLASRFVLMSRKVYQEDWRSMQPNRLDPIDRAPDWFVFRSFPEALARYFELEHAGVTSEAEQSDRVILDTVSNAPWDALAEVIEMNDVQSFLEGVASHPGLSEVHRVLRAVYGRSTDTDEKVDVFKLDTAWHGFIDPRWYRETYAPRTHGMEHELIQQSPLVHYVMLGSRKRWSLSPYFDEVVFNREHDARLAGKKAAPSLSDKIGLAKFFLSEWRGEVSESFSSAHYIEQCKQLGIALDASPVIHFLRTGIKLGLQPHPHWNETAYLELNPDVKRASGGQQYGWLHWCTHGRFEKRPGAFGRKGS
jgi:glycosyltransferase involved in cell wall biosynthesis